MILLNRLHFYVLTILALSTLLLSCRPGRDELIDPVVTLVDLDELLRQVPDRSVLDTTFRFMNLRNDATVSTKTGLRILLKQTERLFAKQDSPTVIVPCSKCKDLRIKVLEAYRLGDIIGRAIPTSTPANFMLETSGLVRLEAQCDGTKLALAKDAILQVQIPADKQLAGLDTDPLFISYNTPTVSITAQSGWTITNNPVGWTNWNPAPATTKIGYDLLTDKMDWLTAARIIGRSSNTTLKVQVGNNNQFTQSNTRVYLLFNKVNGVAPAYARNPDQANIFAFDGAPIGYEATVVVVAKIDQQFYWKKVNVARTIVRDMPLQTVAPDPVSPETLLKNLRELQ